jgi:hypothetical protein
MFTELIEGQPQYLPDDPGKKAALKEKEYCPGVLGLLINPKNADEGEKKSWE